MLSVRFQECFVGFPLGSMEGQVAIEVGVRHSPFESAAVYGEVPGDIADRVIPFDLF